MIRPLIRTFVTAFVLTVFAHVVVAAQQTPPIAGKWTGSVDTDQGTMDIALSLTVDKDKVNGTITTSHGDLAVSNGAYVKDKWRLPFNGHGMKGEIVGTIKNDTFEGVWDNSPLATGSVKLQRVK